MAVKQLRGLYEPTWRARSPAPPLGRSKQLQRIQQGRTKSDHDDQDLEDDQIDWSHSTTSVLSDLNKNLKIKLSCRIESEVESKSGFGARPQRRAGRSSGRPFWAPAERRTGPRATRGRCFHPERAASERTSERTSERANEKHRNAWPLQRAEHFAPQLASFVSL